MKGIILPLTVTLIVSLAFLLSPSSAQRATNPTEVNRVKDYYYFEIHGGPWTPEPSYGKAEFSYKNLSTKTQSINVLIEVTWLGIHRGFWQFPWVLGPGDEWSSNAPEDFGVTAHFELYINGSLEFSGIIWVPPT